MEQLLFGWMGLLAVLLAFSFNRRHGASTLTLSYFLAFSVIHVPGAWVQSNDLLPLPGYVETKIGFQYTMISMAALVAGGFVALFNPFAAQKREAAQVGRADPEALYLLNGIGNRLFVAGLVAFFILPRFFSWLPSSTAVITAFATSLVIGLWLRFYSDSQTSVANKIVNVGILPLLPLSTIIAGGFIGYGTSWLISSVSFLYNRSRNKLLILLALPFAFYLSISVFATYLAGRVEIRDVVWFQQGSFSARVGVVMRTFGRFEFFDYNNAKHLGLIDMRLNQNYLVGRAVDEISSGRVQLARGESFSPLQLIPRALWPDKPAIGGGGDLVTRMTGMTFAEGTSVGAGQVLEFYANFGMIGMIAGFFMLGWILKRLDLGISRAFAQSDVKKLLLFGLPGLAMLQPGGNLIEIIITTLAAFLVALFVNKYLFHLLLPAGLRRARAKAPAKA